MAVKDMAVKLGNGAGYARGKQDTGTYGFNMFGRLTLDDLY